MTVEKLFSPSATLPQSPARWPQPRQPLESALDDQHCRIESQQPESPPLTRWPRVFPGL